MNRIPAHVTETESRQIFERSTTLYSNEKIGIQKGDIVFRVLSERDYGIDGEIELFSNGDGTGRIARIQLKGTQNSIASLKRTREVSCTGITKSNLTYCRQFNVPVILVYCSVRDEKFYYIDLQSVFRDKINEIADNYSGTVRIPEENNSENLSKLISIINSYYDNYTSYIYSRKKTDYNVLNFHLFDIFAESTETYEFIHSKAVPTDGEHKEIGLNGCTMSEGYWKEGRLLYGTEYEWLIRVVSGKLYRKEEIHLDSEYACTSGFDYQKLEQNGWEVLGTFTHSMAEIDYYGLDNYYVVDFDIEEEVEQMKNVRPLREYLQDQKVTVFVENGFEKDII